VSPRRYAADSASVYHYTGVCEGAFAEWDDTATWQIGAATRSEFALIPADSASAHFIKVTQRIPVRIAIENPDGLLKPGMMVGVGSRVK
jgi:hypothetical protein